jgi:glycosyltransferase involved in cell wall biosynthesis
VLLGEEPFDLRRGSDALFVVLPAGVRAVKQPRFPIEPLERLRAEGLDIRYVILGPELEEGESTELRRAFASRPWCSRIEVAPAAMPAALRAADLVLNCSRVEGFSNAVAEALSVGACVLAAAIPGNRAALGTSGVLFSSPKTFFSHLRRLLLNPKERSGIGAAAKADAATRFAPSREIDALLKSYEGDTAEAQRTQR